MEGVRSARESRQASSSSTEDSSTQSDDDSLSMQGSVVALPEDQPSTSGLSVRTASEVSPVSAALSVESPKVAGEPLSQECLTGKLIRRRRSTVIGRRTKDQTNATERDRQNRMRKVLDGLREELPDRFKGCKHKCRKIPKKYVIAYAVDYLNELGAEVIRLTENRDVRFAIRKFSESVQITKGYAASGRKEKEKLRYDVITAALETLREALAGLGVNAVDGMTNDDLKNMNVDFTSEGLQDFKRKFSEILTLHVALEMMKALKVQRDQRLQTISYTAQ